MVREGAYIRGGDLVLFSMVAGIRAKVCTIPNKNKAARRRASRSSITGGSGTSAHDAVFGNNMLQDETSIFEGWVTILLPDGKALFREQTDADRTAEEEAATVGAT